MNIIITGAGGYLGSSLIDLLLKKTDFLISAVTSKPEALAELYLNEARVNCYGNSSPQRGDLPVQDCFALVHLAFARRFSSDAEIAGSIEFSRQVFEATRNQGIPRLIYISSQGVYGNTPEIRRVGQTTIAPSMIYTMAKYATEQLLVAIFKNSEMPSTASIRLDSLAGNQKMLPAFVQQAIEKRHISVVGGTQRFSFLDVRDAAEGILALLKTDTDKWQKIYNLGWNAKIYGIMELAHITAQVAQLRGYGEVSISLDEKAIQQFAGMDTSEFMHDTGWYPRYDIQEIVSKLFDEYREREV